ncbi:MAG TPA: hypothetical protein VG538_11510 [Vicinamibacterales bacterium]|nr:hypothetical protein [Vicinamibacterales bacterium]
MTERADRTIGQPSPSPADPRERAAGAAGPMAQGNWRRFEPIGYTINWPLVYNMAATEVDQGGGQAPTSVGTILSEALPHLFVSLNEDGSLGARTAKRHACDIKQSTGRITVLTPNRQIELNTFGHGWFAAQVIALCVQIDRQCGSATFDPIFFYYDEDHVVDDFHEAFSFFVVNNDRIVLDRVSVTRTRDNGFDPRVFEPAYGRGPKIWCNTPAVERAQVRWWYRRFYEETDAGRLTLLRDDVDIYGYTPESRQLEQIASRVEILARDTARLRQFAAGVLALLVLIAILLWR